jgi:hypothetical protein
MSISQRLADFCVLVSSALYVLPTNAPAQEKCRSGLQAGQRPGPYAALVATGSLRGQSHCFICETADKPAVIIFARTLSEPLGNLAHQLDKVLPQYKAADLRAWVTFLSDDQTAMDPQIVKWGQKHATGNIPLGVFEDLDGPPSYRLSRDADVTVLLSVQQRVVANFAFRPGELTEARIAEVLRALAQLTAPTPR